MKWLQTSAFILAVGMAAVVPGERGIADAGEPVPKVSDDHKSKVLRLSLPTDYSTKLPNAYNGNTDERIICVDTFTLAKKGDAGVGDSSLTLPRFALGANAVCESLNAGILKLSMPKNYFSDLPKAENGKDSERIVRVRKFTSLGGLQITVPIFDFAEL